MLKRVILIMLSLCTITSFTTFALNDAKDDPIVGVIRNIAPYLMEGADEPVIRSNCIATIMKLIGVDRETANKYINTFYDQPIFEDVWHNAIDDGYIIAAKYGDVAVGVKHYPNDGINYFEPNRNTTVKECLAFMLRCLTEPNTVMWDNVTSQAKEVGLLNEEEYVSIEFNGDLTSKDFYTLISRMLDMNRYLYWPTENTQPRYATSMQIDYNRSIKYIDWILGNSIN